MSTEYLFDEDGEDYGMGSASDSYSSSQQQGPSSSTAAGSSMNNNNNGGSLSNHHHKFTSLSSQDVISTYIDPLVLKVSRPLQLSRASAIFLLYACKWNDEQAITSYFEDETRICKKAGFKPCQCVSGDVADVQDKKPKTYTCNVCFDDETETMAGAALTCDHAVCKECWKGVLENSIAQRGDQAWLTICPQHKCGLPAAPIYDYFGGDKSFADDDDDTQGGMLNCEGSSASKKSLKEKLEERLAKLYVGHNNHMFSRCSNPSCDRYLYCGPSKTNLPPRSTGNIVKCQCNQMTCVRCELPNHLPASCDHMKSWESKEHADSANANWIVANTRQCPNTKCKKPIEKNQGCNHMHCSQCGHDFCWICMGDWSKHGSNYYNCNKRVEDPTRDAAANEIERYIHYYSRYRNHEKSKSLDGVTVTKARAKIEAMVRSGNARLHDADFWEKTAYALIACRRTLMYSYVYAYYLPSSTSQEKGEKELFEYQQGQLEHATEMLSEYVTASNSGAASAQEVVARMSVAQQMLKNLEEGVMK